MRNPKPNDSRAPTARCGGCAVLGPQADHPRHRSAGQPRVHGSGGTRAVRPARVHQPSDREGGPPAPRSTTRTLPPRSAAPPPTGRTPCPDRVPLQHPPPRPRPGSRGPLPGPPMAALVTTRRSGTLHVPLDSRARPPAVRLPPQRPPATPSRLPRSARRRGQPTIPRRATRRHRRVGGAPPPTWTPPNGQPTWPRPASPPTGRGRSATTCSAAIPSPSPPWPSSRRRCANAWTAT